MYPDQLRVRMIHERGWGPSPGGRVGRGGRGGGWAGRYCGLISTLGIGFVRLTVVRAGGRVGERQAAAADDARDRPRPKDPSGRHDISAPPTLDTQEGGVALASVPPPPAGGNPEGGAMA